jgi:hypothetical protein
VNSTIWALALHGGAGVIDAARYRDEERHMDALVRSGGAMLEGGMSALDVVANMVEQLEASGLHVAGKGAASNEVGAFECRSGNRSRSADSHAPARDCGEMCTATPGAEAADRLAQTTADRRIIALRSHETTSALS